MEHRRLHPNLARLAATYDDILEQFSRSQITAEEARVRVGALVGRDDQGVQWCISPDDGRWHRITVDGRLVPDDPPEAGLATYTGWDLSGSESASDPRFRVVDHRVDPREVGGATELAGSTARFVRNEADERRRVVPGGRVWMVVAAVLVVVALVSLGMALRGTDGADVPVDRPAPTTVRPGG